MKQAARSWNQKINEELIRNGFKRGKADICLYSKQVGKEWIYVLIYVDDIIMASKSETLLLNTENFLKSKFEIKNLGDLKYYLGVQFYRDQRPYL